MSPRPIRRLVYEAEKMAQSQRFRDLPRPPGGWPAILGISFPKSGTHLLDQILLGFARFAPFSRRLHSFYAEYEGPTGVRRGERAARAWVDGLRPLDVASAHLFARPAVVERVSHERYLPYFIFRDPRDVVVSHVHYVTDMEDRHVHHHYFRSLPDFGARLEASILGRPDASVEFPDIGSRFAPYLGWLAVPSVLPLHFEDLVNDPPAALDRIAEHFFRRVPIHVARAEVVAALQGAIDPARSPTFRAGKTGEWKASFEPRHKELFKQVAGDLLIRLGYEKDVAW